MFTVSIKNHLFGFIKISIKNEKLCAFRSDLKGSGNNTERSGQRHNVRICRAAGKLCLLHRTCYSTNKLMGAMISWTRLLQDQDRQNLGMNLEQEHNNAPLTEELLASNPERPKLFNPLILLRKSLKLTGK